MKPSGTSTTILVATAFASTAAAISLSLYLAATNGRKRDNSQKESSNDGNDDSNESKTTIEKSCDDVSRRLNIPISEVGGNDTNVVTDDGPTNDNRKRILTKNCITIVHGSMTGTCSKFASDLYDTLMKNKSNLHEERIIQIGSTEDWDWWDELLNDDSEDEAAKDTSTSCCSSQKKSTNAYKPVLILLLPTYTNGTWPPCATGLENALQDLQNDWRIEKQPLKTKIEVAIFGMGSSEYYDDVSGISNMGKPAKDAARSLQKLGVRCITKLRIGEDAVGNHANETYDVWKMDILNRLNKQLQTKKSTNLKSCCEEKEESGGVCCSDNASENTKNLMAKPSNTSEEPAEYDSDDDDSDDDDDDEPEVMDLEDMGDAVMASKNESKSSSEPPEMVTPGQAKALKKEGYKLIGTHSAVKLCRWTKHQLRGRGGCYKHTFYGITSYQCMEATPSLACANKCVFCWRHHKNPVGKEWRWKTDDPNFIVEEAVKKHVEMIKEAKGIPGVQMDRWQEAHTVRHCALSLVGEPIMYPRIDELLADLHRRNISSFLVTNGQHPAAIGSLRPVTQLYVSVDAPTEESLIAIDRPLFSDAWDRLKQSLCSLKDKGQRTVARLTVVKGWNSDEVEGYAKLIALGKVSLVEVKGVTFCGKSDASNLNMSNSPWHHEVVALTETLKKEIDKIREGGGDDSVPEYGLACEHKHSCSVLLARVDQFSEDDPATGKRTWKTWINYDKFQELAAKHVVDPSFTFSVQDYTAETPTWALFGAEEEGFDPTDRRHRKKTKHPMYTQYDSRGVPTHDDDGNELSAIERQRLSQLMDVKMREVGSGSTVTELKGGAKEIMDASLMFRGLVVTK